MLPPGYERRPGPKDDELTFDERNDAEHAWRRALELEAIARRRGEDASALRWKYLEELEEKANPEPSPEEIVIQEEIQSPWVQAAKAALFKAVEEEVALEKWGDGLFEKYGWRPEPGSPTASSPEGAALEAVGEWLHSVLGGGHADEEYAPLRDN